MKYKYNSTEYRHWRDYIMKRDHHTCQLCGQKGRELNAHHIKRKADFPKLVYDKNNGILLCVECHHIITGHEKIFEHLFVHIVSHTLTLDYVKKFFMSLSKFHKSIVQDFIKKDIWQKIPEQLVKKIKIIRINNNIL